MEDIGYFPPGSVLRHVQEQRVVGLHYGQRALCIGAIKPLNFVGTNLHSSARARPFNRLAQTGKMFETIFFGTRAQADRVLSAVHGMHQRVQGVLPSDEGPAYPAGTPYAALDPQLMLWTMAVMADSALTFYELLVAPLDDAQRDSLWSDYVRFGELFGMPREVAPASFREFRDWWEGEVGGADVYLSTDARVVGYASAFEIPLPRRAQAGKRVADALMLGSLPPRVRELYGLSYGRRQQSAYRAAVALMRAGAALAPRAIACGGNARTFELVAATERSRIARGRPTPQFA
jgi:uncharacterized protein (DUF2236 family)